MFQTKHDEHVVEVFSIIAAISVYLNRRAIFSGCSYQESARMNLFKQIHTYPFLVFCPHGNRPDHTERKPSEQISQPRTGRINQFESSDTTAFSYPTASKSKKTRNGRFQTPHTPA